MLEGLKLLAAAIDRRHPIWVLFSALFGIGAPIACVVIDRRFGLGLGSTFLDGVVGTMIAALIVFLLLRPTTRWALAVLAGVLGFGALVALIYAQALSWIGLTYIAGEPMFGARGFEARILGIAGVLPIFAFIAYLLNALSALGCAAASKRGGHGAVAVVVGFAAVPLLGFGFLRGVDSASEHTVQAIVSGDRERAGRAVLWSRTFAWAVDWTELARGLSNGHPTIDGEPVECADLELARESFCSLTGKWPLQYARSRRRLFD